MDKTVLMEAGFTEEQADVMLQMFALVGHSHDADDINGLDEAIHEVVDEEEDEEEEEE